MLVVLDDVSGQYIDDDRGASYKVIVERVKHLVTVGLLGNTYYYGDDIDSSTLIPDHQIHRSCLGAGWGLCTRRTSTIEVLEATVIVAYDLNG